MKECSYAKEGERTCDIILQAENRVEFLKNKLKQCREYLQALQQAFEINAPVIASMHAFRLLTKKVESGQIEVLLEDLDTTLRR